MKIIEIKELAFKEIKIIRFARFNDHRGYFTEPYRKSDFANQLGLEALKNIQFVQCNESFSVAQTIRGLHFQWNPYMGKLVRTVSGHMVDMVLDIRKGSPNFGKIIAYDMPTDKMNNYNEWIWVPPGFAHGNFFLADSQIEYFCSGEYSPNCEAGISPLAVDIDWSLCDENAKKIFKSFAQKTKFISDKDKNGLSVNAWAKDKRSENFIYAQQ